MSGALTFTHRPLLAYTVTNTIFSAGFSVLLVSTEVVYHTTLSLQDTAVVLFRTYSGILRVDENSPLITNPLFPVITAVHTGERVGLRCVVSQGWIQDG